MTDLVIKGGKIVTPGGIWEAALAIQDGSIAALGDAALFSPAAETLDAKGLHILPGLVDDHVHLREPGLTYKEDIETGTRAAAAGGVTTVLDMPNTVPAVASVEILRCKMALAEGRSHVDLGLYAVVTDENVDQLGAIAAAGAVGFKVFMGETTSYVRCPNDGLLFKALRSIRETGLRVGAHAENDAILQQLKSELIEQGRTDPLAHLESRPAFAEVEAISRALVLTQAAGNAFHVFHLSTREGLELVTDAKRKGLPVTAEVLVGHLLLDADDYARLGNRIRLNPPIRTREHQQALWDGLRRGQIDNLATDHAPHTAEEKTAENVWDAACGFIGVETALPLMLTEVNRGRLPLEQYVRLACENPARIWGLYPRKGSIHVGADADLVLVDLKQTGVIDSNKLHNKNRITPFHGRPVQGMPRYTILRGQVIMAEGELQDKPSGRLLRPAPLNTFNSATRKHRRLE